MGNNQPEGALVPNDMNTVNLVGRLTRDPEQRGGGAVTSMRLAFTTREKQGDEWADKSNFVDVTAFGRTGDTVFQYCTKGRRVGVTGRLSWREWDDKDGNKRQSIEVIANDVYFLDSASGTEQRSTPDLPADTTGMRAKPDDTDVPF